MNLKLRRSVKHPALDQAAIPLVTWCLLVAVILLGASEIVGARWLNHRAELQRQGFCAILDRFPAGNPALDTARTDYRCGPPAPPKVAVTPTPRPTVTVTKHKRIRVTAPPRVIVTPGPPQMVVTPGPTVTVTKKPAHHKKPRRTPTPQPCMTVKGTGLCPTLPPLSGNGLHLGQRKHRH